MIESCRAFLAKIFERIRRLRTFWVFVWVVVLGLYYGLCMAAYSLFLGGGYSAERGERVLSAMLKVPLLLLVIWSVAGVMLAGFYRVGNGTRIRSRTIMRWTGDSMMAMGLILAVLSPVILVPALTQNYAACVLLNYVVFSVAGSGAVVSFAHALRPTLHGRACRTMTLLAFLCFAIIGGGAGWALRPFIGYNGQPFTWFRVEHSSVFEQIYYEWHNLWHY